MFIWQPANTKGRSSSLDGCLAAIASHLTATASRLETAARHLSMTATQLANIARPQAMLAKCSGSPNLFSCHHSAHGDKKI